MFLQGLNGECFDVSGVGRVSGGRAALIKKLGKRNEENVLSLLKESQKDMGEVIATQAELDRAAKNFVVGKEYVYEEHLDEGPFRRLVFDNKRGGPICLGTPYFGSRWILDPKSDPKDPMMVRVKVFSAEKPTKKDLQECANYKSPRDSWGDSTGEDVPQIQPTYEPPVEAQPPKQVQSPLSDEDKGGIPMWVWYSIGGIAAFYAYRHFTK